MKMIKSVFTLVGCGCFLALLSGCASVMCGTKQAVALTSKPTGAQVLVYDTHCEVVFRGVTPCTANLARRNDDYESASYTVLLKKQGYAPVQVALAGQLNRAYFANILCGGVGFLADPITGGMWTLTPQTTDLNALSEPAPSFDADGGLLVSLKEQTAPPTVAEHFEPVSNDAQSKAAAALAELDEQFKSPRSSP